MKVAAVNTTGLLIFVRLSFFSLDIQARVASSMFTALGWEFIEMIKGSFQDKHTYVKKKKKKCYTHKRVIIT